MTSFICILGLVVLGSAFTYDETLAKELTAISFAAQCPNEALLAWDVGYVSRNYPSMQNVQVFTNAVSGTKGFVGYNSKLSAITFVFRGSDNIQNWIENITVAKSHFNDACNCKVHTGFKNAYHSLKDEAMGLLKEYTTRYPYAKIHITGHSLGGAMATLLATEISQLGYNVILVTQGSPRVGDGSFYNWVRTLRITGYRIVNRKDTVPHLPPKSFGFTHVDMEIWYTDDGYTVCNEKEDKQCSDSVVLYNNGDHSEYVGWSSSVDC